MEQITQALTALGPYVYLIIGLFAFSGLFAFFSFKMNKASKEKWLANHEGAVKINLETKTTIITQNSLYANVISGDAAVFFENGKYIIYSMPGQTVLELTYTYTRPGVLYKNVSTTWGPSRIEINVKAGKEYTLTFNKKEEDFKLSENNW